jgi:hypothetical protein
MPEALQLNCSAVNLPRVLSISPLLRFEMKGFNTVGPQPRCSLMLSPQNKQATDNADTQVERVCTSYLVMGFSEWRK